MPKTAPKIKKAAVKGYGAEISECEPTIKARESNPIIKAMLDADPGLEFVHPSDDVRVIAGQGTTHSR